MWEADLLVVSCWKSMIMDKACLSLTIAHIRHLWRAVSLPLNISFALSVVVSSLLHTARANSRDSLVIVASSFQLVSSVYAPQSLTEAKFMQSQWKGRSYTTQLRVCSKCYLTASFWASMLLRTLCAVRVRSGWFPQAGIFFVLVQRKHEAENFWECQREGGKFFFKLTFFYRTYPPLFLCNGVLVAWPPDIIIVQILCT